MNVLLVPFRWLLDLIYSGVGSYWLAIILYTLVIKLILMPLSYKQRKSMRRMSDLKPKIDAINAKYEKDPEKKSMKTMELYKKEKVSPFSGCLPLLIQFPILIAMFAVMRNIADEQTVSMFLNVLKNGAEAFQPDSFLWISNIWQPDNIMATVIPTIDTIRIAAVEGNAILSQANIDLMNVSYTTVMQPLMDIFNTGVANGWAILPLATGVTSFLSTKLMNAGQPEPVSEPGKPNTQKFMKYLMPAMSIFFCWQYNAAFAMYWLVANVYQIGEYYLINFMLDRKAAKQASALEEVKK